MTRVVTGMLASATNGDPETKIVFFRLNARFLFNFYNTSLLRDDGQRRREANWLHMLHLLQQRSPRRFQR